MIAILFRDVLCLSSMAALALVMMAGGVVRFMRGRKRLLATERVNRGFCPTCSYDLAGQISTACPECGHRFSDNEMRRLQNVAPVLQRARREQ